MIVITGILRFFCIEGKKSLYSPVVLEFDLKRKTFSTASYTEKYALQHTESPKESSEGKAWKMSHTVSKFIRIISINIINNGCGLIFTPYFLYGILV